MSITLSCPHCERAYTLADTQRGKTIRCKDCNGTFKVEGRDEARAGTLAKAKPDTQVEDEIPFSGVGILKSLLWLITWQLICLGMGIGIPILGFVAWKDKGLTLEIAAVWVVCGLCT